MTVLLDLLMKSVVLVAVGLVAARLAARSAALASLVFSILVGGLLALPWLSGTLPTLQVSAFSVRHEVLDTRWWAGLWLAGAMLGIVRILRDWRAAANLAARAIPVSDPRLEQLLARALGLVRCQRTPQLRETSELGTAALIGWRHPIILLPAELRSWSDDDALGVLCHELEHQRRNDWLMLLAERFAAALYWPNPLIHWALRRSARVREQAADDAVLRGGLEIDMYATRLIALARAPVRPNGLVSVAYAGGEIDSRVRALFASRRHRGRVSATTCACGLALAIPFLLLIAAAQPWICLPGAAAAARIACP